MNIYPQVDHAESGLLRVGSLLSPSLDQLKAAMPMVAFCLPEKPPCENFSAPKGWKSTRPPTIQPSLKSSFAVDGGVDADLQHGSILGGKCETEMMGE